MVAAAITGGDVIIDNAVPEHNAALISKLEEMGVVITELNEGVRVTAQLPLKSVDLKTMPHPGFPTDMQSQMMALMLTATGTGVLTETVFENRFMHVEEFRRMNGAVKIEGRSVIITGPSELQGAEVAATDLRAAAALILAGLMAEGVTRVTELSHLDRGYVNFHGKLAALGADIVLVSHQRHKSKKQRNSCNCIEHSKRAVEHHLRPFCCFQKYTHKSTLNSYNRIMDKLLAAFIIVLVFYPRFIETDTGH